MLKSLFRVSWNLKNADIICYILTSLVSLQLGNVQKSEKSDKTVNIEGESYIFEQIENFNEVFSERCDLWEY